MMNMKKLLALLLAIVMVVGMFPMTAMAEGEEPTCATCGSTEHTEHPADTAPQNLDETPDQTPADNCENCDNPECTGCDGADSQSEEEQDKAPEVPVCTGDKTTCPIENCECKKESEPVCTGDKTTCPIENCACKKESEPVCTGDKTTCPIENCACKKESEPVCTGDKNTCPIENCTCKQEPAILCDKCKATETNEDGTVKHAETCETLKPAVLCEKCGATEKNEDGSVKHSETCETLCTCTPVDGVHQGECIFAPVVENAGPQVGDKIWIKSGSKVYKNMDDNRGHTLILNYHVTIESIEYNEEGAATWYKFSPAVNWFGKYEYVKVENTTVENPEENNACNCQNPPENLAQHADSCPRKQYVKTLFENKTAEEIYAEWENYDEETQNDILAMLEVYDQNKSAELKRLVEAAEGKEVLVGDISLKVQGVPEEVTLDAETVSTKEWSEEVFDAVGSKKVVFAIDITLNGVEGQWQPGTGEKVTVSLDAASMGLSEGERIGILHEHEGELNDLGICTVTEGKLTFTTTGFSVFYGYTVDFEYDGTWYSIPGMSEIHLSILMPTIGINRHISEVSNVVFSDYSLIAIEKQIYDGNMVDWYLKSLQPFTSEEILNIYFKDGSEVSINVYDAISGTTSGTVKDTNNVSGTYGQLTISGNASLNLTGNVIFTSTVIVPKDTSLTITSSGNYSMTRNHTGAMFDVQGNLTIGNASGGNHIIIKGSTSQSNPIIYYHPDGGSNSIEINDTTIEDNWGRAILVTGDNVSITVNRSTIRNCRDNAGSAIYLQGGGKGPVTFNKTVIENCSSSEVTPNSYDDWGGYNSSSAMKLVKESIGENCAGTVRTNGGGNWTLSFNDCVFRNNETWGHGAGIYWNATGAKAKLTISDCQFIDNWALNFGGAVFNEAITEIKATAGTMTAPIRTGSVPAAGITGTLFVGNSAGDPNTDGIPGNDEYAENNGEAVNNRGYGGAICQKTYNSGYAGDSVQTVSLLLSDNILIDDNNAHYGGGLMLYVREDVTNSNVKYAIAVNGSTISRNHARQNGGGVYLWNALGNYATALELNSGIISNNTARNGAGAYVINTDVIFGTSASVENSIKIADNVAASSGGALYLEQIQMGTVNNNDGIANTSVRSGTISGNRAGLYGGGIYQTGTKGECTVSGSGEITNNQAGNGGGIYVAGGSQLSVTGGIISGNRAKPDGTEMDSAMGDAVSSGVGGGIYVASGTTTNPSTFNMTAAAGSAVGIHSNTATYAANDVYASGSNTRLTLPTVDNMDLAGYNGRATGWFADYHDPDNQYPKQIQVDGKNTENPGRYDPKQEDNVRVNAETYLKNSDTYYCLTLGKTYGNLSITKKLKDAAGKPYAADQTMNFLFTIEEIAGTGTPDTYLPVMVTIEKGRTEASISIAHLEEGQYTITEDGLWSWRFTVDEKSKKVTLNYEASAPEVIFENTLAKYQWLDGEAKADNTFDSDGTVVTPTGDFVKK